jgi:hypothetical protein
MGKVKKILSDLGSQFTAHIYAETLKSWGVEFCFTSVRHPSANPVERVMKELGRLCRVYCGEAHQSWGRYIQQFEFFINNVKHCTTGYTPNELFFDQQFNIRLILSDPQNHPTFIIIFIPLHFFYLLSSIY